jgi:hypothetical protein
MVVVMRRRFCSFERTPKRARLSLGAAGGEDDLGVEAVEEAGDCGTACSMAWACRFR